MSRISLHRHLLVNAGGAVAQPPPARASGIAFLTRFLLISMGIVMAVALMVSAPPTVIFPLGIVFGGYAFATAVVAAKGRSQRRPDRVESPPVVPHPWGVLAGLSVVLLVLAAVVPEGAGHLFAVTGFVGLLTYRIMAARQGWFPRR